MNARLCGVSMKAPFPKTIVALGVACLSLSACRATPAVDDAPSPDIATTLSADDASTAHNTPAAEDTHSVVNADGSPDASATATNGLAAPPTPTLDALDRARAAAQAFGAELKGTLLETMRNDGPEHAVTVCQSAAPSIATRVGETHGVRIGRVTLPQKNRNKDNEAQGWQLDALQAMQRAVDGGASAAEQVFAQQDNLPEGTRFRMMRGLETEGLCTTCHGTSVSPSVLAAIDAHYPDDGAVGFKEGDLRGGLWVEVP